MTDRERTVDAGRRASVVRRVLVQLSAGAARILTRLSPRRLRLTLEQASRGARPATVAEALAAREAVVRHSLHCRGANCLQRSVAAALYCRLHGTWPTWCTGVRTEPFVAHAWIAVDDTAVGESFSDGYYHTIMAVPPRR